jgi:hypothetical protein
MKRRDKETIIREKVEELRAKRKSFTKSKTLSLNSAVGMLYLLGVPMPWYVPIGVAGANILLRMFSTEQGVK